MIVMTWNVRGFNDPSKLLEVKNLVAVHRVKLLCLIEMRVKEGKASGLMRKFSSCWSWVHNYPCSHKGRLWVGWNRDCVQLKVSSASEQIISCVVADVDNSMQFNVDFVYGLHSVGARKSLWNELKEHVQSSTLPWIAVTTSMLYLVSNIGKEELK